MLLRIDDRPWEPRQSKVFISEAQIRFIGSATTAQKNRASVCTARVFTSEKGVDNTDGTLPE